MIEVKHVNRIAILPYPASPTQERPIPQYAKMMCRFTPPFWLNEKTSLTEGPHASLTDLKATDIRTGIPDHLRGKIDGKIKRRAPIVPPLKASLNQYLLPVYRKTDTRK
ncbi:MAG: hypothetical protein Q7Q73_05065 [Verrucomicrobiota bacterium JB024]|nr:hypothetical protein [Verrucomicrobiota bacterium JB024]